MDGELATLDALPRARLGNQLLREPGRLCIGHHPADDVAAEHVEDYVQVEVGPLDQMRRVKPLPTQQRAELTPPRTGRSLAQNATLLLGGELPPLCLRGHFGCRPSCR